jgi:hypothetical protein
LRDDTEGFAKRFGLDPDLELRYGRKALGIEGGNFSYQRRAPNVAGTSGHRHQTQEEVHIVIAGSGQVKFDDEVHDVRQWDVIPRSARGGTRVCVRPGWSRAHRDRIRRGRRWRNGRGILGAPVRQMKPPEQPVSVSGRRRTEL